MRERPNLTSFWSLTSKNTYNQQLRVCVSFPNSQKSTKSLHPTGERRRWCIQLTTIETICHSVILLNEINVQSCDV